MSGLDFAVVGNCAIAALIDRRGSIVWLCLPRLDGDPVFASLLGGDNSDGEGPEGGVFAVDLDGLAESEQRYIHNTAIVETLLSDGRGGRLRIVDFAPRYKQFGRFFRPSMLIRRIEPLAGGCRIRIRVEPRFGYGARVPRRILGSNHIRFLHDDSALRVTTDAPIAYIEGAVWFVLDAPITLVLSADETLVAAPERFARDSLDSTADYWREWVRYLSVPFQWQDAVIRGAITLKLCAFEETGAIVAALTTSVPESADSGRNWDYRYCWLRDAYFVVQALNRLGATRTMEDFIRYIANVAALDRDKALKPVYAIVPGASLDEREAPALAGYRGMGPVRIGNLAERQIQHDSYGSVIVAAAQMFFDRRLPRPGDGGLFASLEVLGDRAERHAFEPDASLWEYRGRSRVHTYSSVMCWAGCKRLAKIAGRLGFQDKAERWNASAERLRPVILEKGWSDKRGAFVDCFDGENLDASLLLLHEVGFISAADPRYVATVEAIDRELRRGDFVMRYNAPDDFGRPHNAFVVATFWHIDALTVIGRREEAKSMFEAMLARRNHVGLLSEAVDPSSGRLWGNFPQTYSMVGLINSAMRLSKTWEEAFWRDS